MIFFQNVRHPNSSLMLHEIGQIWYQYSNTTIGKVDMTDSTNKERKGIILIQKEPQTML